jgi:hypothetical protein
LIEEKKGGKGKLMIEWARERVVLGMSIMTWIYDSIWEWSGHGR